MAKAHSPASKLQADMLTERRERIRELLKQLRHEIYALNSYNLAENEQTINQMLELVDKVKKD